MNEDIYKYDILNRNPGYSFADSVVNGVTTIQLKNDLDVVVNQAVVRFNDRGAAVFKIRQNVVGGKSIIPGITTTQRDNSTGVIDGTRIWNLTTLELEVCNNGGDWTGGGGERGSLVHLPAATVETIDNTETSLHTLTLEENTAYLFTAEVIGEVEDHSIVLGAIIEVTAKRITGGVAVIVGNVSTAHEGKDSGAASWSIDFIVSGNDLILAVTGGNATTVKWEADLNYLKY